MIDPERIKRLASRMGGRKDALEFVRQMRCGGKKFDGGGDKYQARDNTRVSSVVPSGIGYIPAEERPLPASLGKARWDDGVMGALPIVGDALQGAQAIKELSDNDLVTGLQTAGLLLVPNIGEKAIRGFFKKATALDVPHRNLPDDFEWVDSGMTVRLTPEDHAKYDGMSQSEKIGMIVKEIDDAKRVTRGLAPIHGVLTPEELGARKPIPQSVKKELSNTTMPRMLKMREGLSPDEIMAFKAKFHDVINGEYTEFPKATRYKAKIRNTVAGQHHKDNDFLWVAKESDEAAKERDIGHELRHRIDEHFKMTDEERKILDDAYPGAFETSHPRKSAEVMKMEKSTTNRDARRVLLGDNVNASIEEQNRIIDEATPADIANAVYNSNGYGRRFIKKLMEDDGGSGYTTTAMDKIREAMKRVGAVAGAGYLGKSLYNMSQEPEAPVGHGVLRPEEYALGGNLFVGGGKFLYSNPDPEYNPNESNLDLMNLYSNIVSGMEIPAVSAPAEQPVMVDTVSAQPQYVPTMLLNYAPTPIVTVPEEMVEEPVVLNLFSDEAKAYRRLKQMYAESNFNKKAVSKAGARGLFQIMPITEKDYITRGKGKAGDVFDPAYNEGIRDYVFSSIPKSIGDVWSDDWSDEMKLAVLYGAYNWGAGNMRNYLRKLKSAGKDISDPRSWVDGLNKETRNYIKFLAFDEDVPGTGMTREAFESSARKNGYMAEGGRLFEDGGEKDKSGWLSKWINRLVTDKTAKEVSEYSGGLLSEDDVKTILEHPDDYKEYLGWDDGRIYELKKNFYNNANRYGYNLQSGLSALNGEDQKPLNSGRALTEKWARDYLLAEYLGIPNEERNEPLAYKMFEKSEYKPSLGGDDVDYIRYSTDNNRNKIVGIYNDLMSNIMEIPGKKKLKPGNFYATSLGNSAYFISPGRSGDNYTVSTRAAYDFNNDPYAAALGQYTIGSGVDENRGQYISVYDSWDLNPFYMGAKHGLPKRIIKTLQPLRDASGGIGNPVKFYDRIYLDDYYGVDSRPQNPDEFYGGYIIPTTITANKEAKGGRVYIKPENRFDIGGPGGSGWNIGADLLEALKKKYLQDYINHGAVYGYPGKIVSNSLTGVGPNQGLLNYVLSPYIGAASEDNDASMARRALLSKYLGIEDGLRFNPSDYIEESPYKPSISSDAKAKYYRMRDTPETSRRSLFDSVAGAYKISNGIDENGRRYVSFYDVWDLSPVLKGRGKDGNDIPGTTPVELYDRFYEDEDPDYYYRVVPKDAPEEYKKQHKFITLDFASGGKIHIKPENRGKFTALKKRTGHSASWFKAHGTPAQKKMAVFALNSRKWKHGNGGPLDKYGDDAVRSALLKLKANKYQEGGPEDKRRMLLDEPARVPDNMSDAWDAATFVENYYSSDGYKMRLSDAGLPAKNFEFQANMYAYPDMGLWDSYTSQFGDVNIGLVPYYMDFPTSRTLLGNTIIDKRIAEDNKYGAGLYPGTVAAHEIAHLNPMFNTLRNDLRDPLRKNKDLSPYYGNDYSNVPPYWMYLLRPNKKTNAHDFEASENYSDLMALRYFLQKNGIFDSMDPNAEFKASDYDKIFDYEGGEHLRYLMHHSKDAVIKALNEVASRDDMNDANFWDVHV